MTKKVSRKNKGTYAVYKTEGRAHKNKIRKLQNHLEAFPHDEQAKKAVERLSKTMYHGRSAPSRDKSLLVSIPGTSTMLSLKLINGRMSYRGKEFQRLTAIAKAGVNESQYKPKSIRDAEAQVRAASLEKSKAIEESKKRHALAKRKSTGPKRQSTAKPANGTKAAKPTKRA